MTPIDLARRTPALPSLTGLRWVAAFVVFGFHVSIAGWFTGRGQGWMSFLFGAGATGVSMFFLLSGFVLAWSHQSGTNPLTFWWRRLSRVYPLHLVGVLLAVLVSVTLVPGIRTLEPNALLANLLLVSSWRAAWWQAGNPVSWSLVCEAFFYLVFPLIILVVRRLPRGPLIVAAALTAMIVVAVPALSGDLPQGMEWSSSPLTRLPEFVLGVLIAVLMRRGDWVGAQLAPAVAVTVVGYSLALAWSGTPFFLSACTILGFALLVSALVRADIERRLTGLTGRALQHLGALSFPFYLVHVLVIQVVSSAWPARTPQLSLVPAVGLTLGTVLVALAVAHLLHTLVEVPARRFLLRAPWPLSPLGSTDQPAYARSESGNSTLARRPSGVPAASESWAP